MSFEELKQRDYTAKKKELSFDIGGKKVNFTANEISYIQKIHLSTMQARGEDAYTQLIVYSIKDEAGRGMTLEQAAGLDSEYAEAFFIAAAEVNAQDKKK